MSGSKMVNSEQRERLLEEHRYINVEYDYLTSGEASELDEEDYDACYKAA